MSTLPPKPSTILGGVLLALLILAILILGLDNFLLKPIAAGQPAIAYFIERSFYWLFVLVLWAYATRVEKQPLLIWEEERYSVGTQISHLMALFFIIMISVNFINFFVSPLTHDESSKVLDRIVDFLRAHKFLLSYTALTAGVTEELIFRGYLQPRLEVLLKNPYWAIFISSLIFGLAHFGYGTVKNVLDPFLIGLALAIYYQRYRNIKVAILFHFLWDMAGLFLLTRYH
ncbi:MAG TPA: CPBP family intramembrane glutamic endopeptidase [Puia sp.]|nr:CPBP family intramembrane glutamic endopeptidase [Puia sp.]